jgi:hypothetical protein
MGYSPLVRRTTDEVSIVPADLGNFYDSFGEITDGEP